jgi:hypothetical protein
MKRIYPDPISNLVRMLAVCQLTRSVQLAEQCEGWLAVAPLDAPEFMPGGSTASIGKRDGMNIACPTFVPR